VLDLGKEIKKNVQNDNMLAWQYNTVGVSDGITMGGEGLSLFFHVILNVLTKDRHALFPANPRDNSRQYRDGHVCATP
jgi:dihydroxyacid dehydratase/phosphogluconate dehydratase